MGKLVTGVVRDYGPGKKNAGGGLGAEGREPHRRAYDAYADPGVLRARVLPYVSIVVLVDVVRVHRGTSSYDYLDTQ